jgi:hypothetical protein
MKLTLKTLERFMQISEDTKKDIFFNKHKGKWAWRDKGESEEVCGDFPTFWAALCDVAGPYLEGEE